jgi:hypothetical protein
MSEAEKPEQQEPPFMDAELAVDAMQVPRDVPEPAGCIDAARRGLPPLHLCLALYGWWIPQRTVCFSAWDVGIGSKHALLS